ncbi:MAG: MAE_28990/MAE_18760 family HEPN-like nuclease [Armatimonadota bacterium]
MKVQTQEILLRLLQEERVWRLFEIRKLDAMVAHAKGDDKALALRAGTALLYAHWEGFVKKSTELYLGYVETQLKAKRVHYNQVSRNVLAVVLRKKAHQASSSKRIGTFLELADFFHAEYADRFGVSLAGSISTAANLTPAVLVEILATLGIEVCDDSITDRFEALDELVADRNSVAHGEHIVPPAKVFSERVQLVLSMTEWVQGALVDAASTNAHMLVR